ncbi:MAG: NusG domain II-containing protein [Magnetococcales bacterium]|nr:NusG domain II-containing protein [Magnetococcales bacterium]
MKALALLGRATTRGDRWLLGLTGPGIVAFGLVMAAPGSRATVFLDNHPLMTLALDRDATLEVAGRLGPVTIQVERGRIRLLEYDSPRMIGTRTGWIQGAGRTIACVPCGILVQVEGREERAVSELDAVSQ